MGRTALHPRCPFVVEGRWMFWLFVLTVAVAARAPLLLAADTVSGWDAAWLALRQPAPTAVPPIPPEAHEDGPPVVRDGRVLFRFHAPDGAMRVSLAADFNRWADNDGGRLTTNRFSMLPAGANRWYRWEHLGGGTHRYIFVVELQGDFQWTKDPHSKEDDGEGHGILRISPSNWPAAAAPPPSYVSRLDVRAEKVWMRPGEPNALRVTLPAPGTASLRIRTPLGTVVHTSTRHVAAGAARIDVPPLGQDGGYLADLEFIASPDTAAPMSGTAVLTVASHIATDIRYGFYSDYKPGDDAGRQAARLADLLINAVEFYDYFPAHGNYAPRDPSYVFEPFGIRIDGAQVRRKIAADRDHNILSIAYVAAYAASRSVFERHPYPMTNAAGATKIFNGQVMTAEEADAQHKPKWFWLMNIAADSPWHRHIMREFSRAIDDTPDDLVSFDGFEIDTYGDARTATFHAAGSRRDGEKLVDVLHDFVADVRDVARKAKPGALVSFNSVDEFGIEQMQDVTDFGFLEIWRRHTARVADLIDICHRGRATDRRRIVLKLYPADMVPAQTAWPTGSLAVVLGATMTGGGSLMVAGEPDPATGTMHGLRTLYYPDHSPIASGAEELLRAYHRHDALCFGYTHGADVHNTPLVAEAACCITRTYAAPHHETLVVQLLRQPPDGLWSTPISLPAPLEELEVSLPLPAAAEPRAVFYASPDDESFVRPTAIPFSCTDGRILIRAPALIVHGTVFIQY